MPRRLLLLVCASLLTSTALAGSGLDPARVRQYAEMLPKEPRGVGPTIADRKTWDAVAKNPQFKKVIADAERLMKQPMPPLTDDQYLDFSRTGNRRRCEAVLGQRHGRLPRFVLAECLENRGRFLPIIEETIRDLCSEKTWVMPAHDRGLENFRGKTVEIDLGAANEAWNLATTDYWLGDKVKPATRRFIRAELEMRTFTPFESAINTGKPRLWWVNGTNNWNAVCLAGVTGAALAIVESPQRRGFFAAAAEKKIQHFLNGFTPDGYCSEGVGYWNYGFGHFTLLAETIDQATGGRADLFDGDRVKPMALFGRHIEINPGVFPSFADCHPGSRPDGKLMAFLSRRYHLGLKDVEDRGLLLNIGPSTRLFELAVFGFENSASKVPPAKSTAPPPPFRDWFKDAGILVCRPPFGQKCPFAVALKGGHNAEHHNHNDVGSYVVALGSATPLVDPGSEVYTRRTFSSHRYDSNVLNSFGHPVPRVAGQLQRPGRDAEAKVLKTQFTDEVDMLVLDIASAYPVKGLRKLERTFLYTRRGEGGLRVVDEVEFDKPQAFGTALITFDKWKQLKPGRLQIGGGAGGVTVDIAATGAALKVDAQEIHEDLPGHHIPTRLGIDLVEPVRKASITVTILRIK